MVGKLRSCKMHSAAKKKKKFPGKRWAALASSLLSHWEKPKLRQMTEHQNSEDKRGRRKEEAGRKERQ